MAVWPVFFCCPRTPCFSVFKTSLHQTTQDQILQHIMISTYLLVLTTYYYSYYILSTTYYFALMISTYYLLFTTYYHSYYLLSIIYYILHWLACRAEHILPHAVQVTCTRTFRRSYSPARCAGLVDILLESRTSCRTYCPANRAGLVYHAHCAASHLLISSFF